MISYLFFSISPTLFLRFSSRFQYVTRGKFVTSLEESQSLPSEYSFAQFWNLCNRDWINWLFSPQTYVHYIYPCIGISRRYIYGKFYKRIYCQIFIDELDNLHLHLNILNRVMERWGNEQYFPVKKCTLSTM